MDNILLLTTRSAQTSVNSAWNWEWKSSHMISCNWPFYSRCCGCISHHYVASCFCFCLLYLVSFYDFHILDLKAEHFTELDTSWAECIVPFTSWGRFHYQSSARGFHHHHCNCHFILYHVCRTLTRCGPGGKYCPIKPDCVLQCSINGCVYICVKKP